MNRQDVFGTACKTCRRRGRKCDRTLPTCTSCYQRGVECEGYLLRWVSAAARGYMAGQTYLSGTGGPAASPRRRCPSTRSLRPDDGSDIRYNLPQSPKTETFSRGDSSENQDGSSASPLLPSDKETELQAVALSRHCNWKIPKVVGPPCDNLEALIGYC